MENYILSINDLCETKLILLKLPNRNYIKLKYYTKLANEYFVVYISLNSS